TPSAPSRPLGHRRNPRTVADGAAFPGVTPPPPWNGGRPGTIRPAAKVGSRETNGRHRDPSVPVRCATGYGLRPMSRLLLVRHGESEWNAQGRWQGQADPPISDHGRHQAAV